VSPLVVRHVTSFPPYFPSTFRPFTYQFTSIKFARFEVLPPPGRDFTEDGFDASLRRRFFKSKTRNTFLSQPGGKWSTERDWPPMSTHRIRFRSWFLRLFRNLPGPNRRASRHSTPSPNCSCPLCFRQKLVRTAHRSTGLPRSITKCTGRLHPKVSPLLRRSHQTTTVFVAAIAT